MKTAPLLCYLLLSLTLSLSAKTWTNNKGQSVEGEFIRMDGDDQVVLMIGTKEHSMPLSDLSEDDQKWISEHQKESSKKSPPGKASLLGVALKPGANTIPLDTSSYPFSDKNKQHSAKSKILLHLPEGFDPTWNSPGEG